MVWETWVQSQVESCQRLKKWYLMPPCLTLSIIRYGSRVKWSNLGKEVAPSPTPWCSSCRKGNFGSLSTMITNLLYTHNICLHGQTQVTWKILSVWLFQSCCVVYVFLLNWLNAFTKNVISNLVAFLSKTLFSALSRFCLLISLLLFCVFLCVVIIPICLYLPITGSSELKLLSGKELRKKGEETEREKKRMWRREKVEKHETKTE